MSDNRKFVEFYNGTKMPSVGLGMFAMDTDELDIVVTTALNAGYRHFDTAFMYNNEKAIGDTLKRIFKQGTIKREDLFIVTKLPVSGMRPSNVESFLRKSLEYLQLDDGIDLYLIHWPVGAVNSGFVNVPLKDITIDNTTDIVAIWKKMEEMVDKGLTKAIGLSNFNVKQIQRVLDNARIKPANLQVECHAYFQQMDLFNFCLKNGITFTAYAPLGSPALSASMLNANGEPLQLPSLLNDPKLKAIAKQHGKSNSQVLLHWMVERGMIVIPKSGNPKRIQENIDIFDFQLSDAETETIKSLDRNARIFKLDFIKGFTEHPEYPF